MIWLLTAVVAYLGWVVARTSYIEGLHSHQIRTHTREIEGLTRLAMDLVARLEQLEPGNE